MPKSLAGVFWVHAQTDVWHTGLHVISAASLGFPWLSRYLPGRSSTGLLSRALGAFAGTRAPTAQLVPQWMGLETSVLFTVRRSFCSAWPPVFACLPPPGSVCFSVPRPTSTGQPGWGASSGLRLRLRRPYDAEGAPRRRLACVFGCVTRGGSTSGDTEGRRS